jgi:hypothetical protein
MLHGSSCRPGGRGAGEVGRRPSQAALAVRLPDVIWSPLTDVHDADDERCLPADRVVDGLSCIVHHDHDDKRLPMRVQRVLTPGSGAESWTADGRLAVLPAVDRHCSESSVRGLAVLTSFCEFHARVAGGAVMAGPTRSGMRTLFAGV